MSINKNLASKKAFTLVELLVVISIIAVLVTIVIIAINPQTLIRNTNDTKKRTELNQVKTSLQLYFNDNQAYPASADLADLTPTYMKQDPTNLGYTVEYESDGDTYVAGVVLENPSSDDGDTETKCANDATTVSFDLTAVNYVICPD
ncbi:MAG: type II secretion system protein [Candidatus Woykebacteria bacterium]